MADSKITRIYLVRHGATVLSAENRFAGASDIELSDEGRRQAELLGKRLASTRIDLAYCSDLKRTVATAAAICKPHGIVATPEQALREIDHGHWEGLEHKDVEARFSVEYSAWTADPILYAPPGGESGLSVLLRALPEMRRIVQEHCGKAVLVVSHKATNRLLLSYLLGLDLRRYRERLDQDLACLNILDFKPPLEPRAVLINDISHYSAAPK
jgi:probable phosphoglycerate mutase